MYIYIPIYIYVLNIYMYYIYLCMYIYMTVKLVFGCVATILPKTKDIKYITSNNENVKVYLQ